MGTNIDTNAQYHHRHHPHPHHRERPNGRSDWHGCAARSGCARARLPYASATVRRSELDKAQA